MVKGPVTAKILTNLQLTSSETQNRNRVYTDPNATEYLVDPPSLVHLSAPNYSVSPSTSSKDQEKFSNDPELKNVKICFDSLDMEENNDQKLIVEPCEDCFKTRSYSSEQQSKDACKSRRDGEINEVCSSDKNQEKDFTNENIDMNKSTPLGVNATAAASTVAAQNY